MIKHTRSKFVALALAVFAFAVLGTVTLAGINNVTPALAQAPSWQDQLAAAVNPQVYVQNNRSIVISWTPVSDGTASPPAANGRLPTQIAIIRSSEEVADHNVITFRNIPGAWSQAVTDGSADKVDVYTYWVELIYEDDNGNLLTTHRVPATPNTISIGKPWNHDVLLDALNPLAFNRSGHQGIRVRWQDTKKTGAQPPAAQGELPTKYQVLRSPADGFQASGDLTRSSHANNGRFRFDDVTAYPGITYTYQIKAFYPNGHTETVTVDWTATGALRMFLNPSAQRGTNDNVTVTWDGAKWSPSEYKVRRITYGTRNNGKRYVAQKTDIGTVSHTGNGQHSYTDTTADPNKEYSYQIRAASPSGKTARTQFVLITDGVQ